MQRAFRRSSRLPVYSLLLLLLLVAGCSAAEPTPSPTSTAVAATASPAAGSVAATSRPAATPTAPPPTAPPAAPSSLIVWHSFADGSPELQTLNALLDAVRPALDTTVDVRALPGDEITTRFEVEAAAGGGPDLLIAANDYLLRQAGAGLLRPLDADIAAQRDSFAPNALAALTVDGKLYGVPLSRSTTTLYFNRAKVPAPPQSTQQLLDAVRGGTKLILVRSTFHSYAFFGAFGGRILDDGGRCVADAGGVANALAFLRDLKGAGAQLVTDGAEAEERFRAGEFDLTVNGSWLLASYRAALPEQLGVAPVPAGPAGPATPLIGATGVYVNATSSHPDAVGLALRLADAQAQSAWADQAGQLPANATAPIADEAIGGLAAAALTGTAWPQRPELGAVWEPFDAALADVLDNNADPGAAVQTACAAVNAANGK